eukprot:2526233-Pyramimonas_sp.AAC.1
MCVSRCAVGDQTRKPFRGSPAVPRFPSRSGVPQPFQGVPAVLGFPSHSATHRHPSRNVRAVAGGCGGRLVQLRVSWVQWAGSTWKSPYASPCVVFTFH